ncbi:MAG: hypothetical protein QGH33_17960 [Pirellulaceae bacterium]|nr:hypothetical protein [Pirellulaceae bacterium]
MDRKFFVDALQGYIEDGKFVVEHDNWHPMVTQTRTLYLPAIASVTAVGPQH